MSRTRRFFLALLCAVIPTWVAAADLTQVERRIAKEPSYETDSPKYFLIALGPDAKARVWIVIDGQVMYVDRNGNNDLTEAGERIQGDEGAFKIDKLFDPNTQRTHTELVVYIDRLIPTSAGTSYVSPFQMTGRVRGRYAFTGITKPADTARQAPMLHLDGPLRARPFGGGFRTVDRAAEKKFSVQLFGRGLGGAIYIEYDGIPAGIYPTAAFVFPTRSPGGQAIKQTVVLKQRC